MNIKSELKRGNLVISECTYCKKIIWPLSEYCNQCFKETSLRKFPNHGKIIEFSKQDNVFFVIAEFENCLRIMGKIILGNPDIGKTVEVVNYGIKDSNYFLEMKVVE